MPRSRRALGFYFETEVRVYDLLWRCLAAHVPDRLAAGHFASICGTFIGGIHPDTGRQYTIVEPQIGGWGASTAATAIAASSPASMARPTIARPRFPRRATACSSTGWN
jgi:N-methylhydantoinase B/oxoprolinase/acetone carboxylase alpha subunit